MFNDLLSEFTGQLKVKNYSAATIGSYRLHLAGLSAAARPHVGQQAGFFGYLQSQGIDDIRQVNKAALQGYQLFLFNCRTKEGNALAAGTIGVKLRAVKRLFAYLAETNHILLNPAENIKEPKQAHKLPRNVLTAGEANRILSMPNESTIIGIRDRAILEVFYSTGLRLSELINLTLFDCDLVGGYVRVNCGKGSKDRVVPLGSLAAQHVKRYVSQVRPEYVRPHKSGPVLFMTRYGTKLSPCLMQIMVRRYARLAGVGKRVTPHTFRHTFATELVRGNADITAVQKMLGHASLAATQVYVHVAGCEVKRTHEVCHPREQDVMEDAVPQIRSKCLRPRRYRSGGNDERV